MRHFFGVSIAILILIFLASCQSSNEAKMIVVKYPDAVIYGEDNRFDYADVEDADLREMARSTVALISNTHLVYDGVFDKYNLERPETPLTMCTSERFRGQPMWAHCSGSLIGPDLVLTAGHCMRDQKNCRDTKFVFDYTKLEKDMRLDSVPAPNVFGCKEIVYTTDKKSAADFALVRLDREVKNRNPFLLSEKEVTYEDQVMMVGYPAGFPVKYTMNGKVRSLLNELFLTVSIDAFAGNSGSSVFDQQTHEIIGVLSRGEADYERENSCYVAKLCAEDACRGEDVTRISQVKKYLPKP